MSRRIDELVESPLVLSDANVWMPRAKQEFSYSDGAGTEAYIESIVANATDLSIDSIELEQARFDWATEYHLSRTRAQLLKAFQFDGSKRVLEVGCGCGAITRFLGERFDEVVAIEGSSVRARIARSRTRDLENVSIVNTPFQEIKFNSKFDLVFCIGVFEYSQMFVDAPDPYDAILRAFDDFLTEDGTLVVAIENQFGLKYFSGSREDHTSAVYDGIEGYPRYKNKARTFGYNELKDRLSPYFPHIQFYFPYPDYKVPECILTERFLCVPHVAELVASYRARDYPDGPNQVFDERLVLLELERNRQLHFFSNSFLVIAGKSEIDSDLFPYLGVHYSSARLPRYQTVTHFVETGNGAVVATKKPVMSDRVMAANDLRLHATASQWTGRLSIQSEIQSHVKNSQLSLQEIFAPAGIWVEYLRGEAKRSDSTPELPGMYIDCIWKNCYVMGEHVEFIDREWEWPSSISIEVLAVRAIYRFICDIQSMSGIRSDLRSSNRRKMIRKIGRQIGLDIETSHIGEFIRLEVSFMATVYGQSRSRLGLHLWMGLTSHRLLSSVMSMTGVVEKIRRKLRYLRLLAVLRSAKN